jgi:hypothetical protein
MKQHSATRIMPIAAAITPICVAVMGVSFGERREKRALMTT